MIVVVGQNSTWQKTYFFDSIQRGAVNRVGTMHESAAGKGANVARVLKGYNIPHRMIAYVGGATGEKFAADCERDGISTRFIEIEGESRTCVTLIENDGSVTELVESAPSVNENERTHYAKAFDDALDSGITLLSVSGTAMAGEPESRYFDFVTKAHEQGAAVLLDAYKGHGRRALDAAPEILKINEHELGELTDQRVDSIGGRRDACTELRKRFGIQWCIITRGAEGIEGFNATAHVRARTAAVDMVNPIGSGDSVTAGILSVLYPALKGAKSGFHAISSDNELFRAAVAEGAAAGTANVLNWKPARIEPGDLERVRGEMLTEELS